MTKQLVTIAKGNTWAELDPADGVLCRRMTVDGRDVLAEGPAGSGPVGVRLGSPDAPALLTWRVTTDAPDRVQATAACLPGAAFPFRCDLTLEVRAAPGTLTVSTTITSSTGVSVPAVLGAGAWLVTAMTAPPGAQPAGTVRQATRDKPYTSRFSIRVSDEGN